MVGNFLSTLRFKGLYPLPTDISDELPEETYVQLEEVNDIRHSQGQGRSKCPNETVRPFGGVVPTQVMDPPCSRADLFDELNIISDEYSSDLDGLCLACVKAGYNDAETNCRQRLACINGHERTYTAEEAEDKWDYV